MVVVTRPEYIQATLSTPGAGAPPMPGARAAAGWVWPGLGRWAVRPELLTLPSTSSGPAPPQTRRGFPRAGER